MLPSGAQNLLQHNIDQKYRISIEKHLHINYHNNICEWQSWQSTLKWNQKLFVLWFMNNDKLFFQKFIFWIQSTDNYHYLCITCRNINVSFYNNVELVHRFSVIKTTLEETLNFFWIIWFYSHIITIIMNMPPLETS